MSSFVRQTTKEIGDGVQHVRSKRKQERDGDSNIKALDKYNILRAGVVSDTIKAVDNVLAGRVPTGFVRVADVFRPLSHGRMQDVPVKKEKSRRVRSASSWISGLRTRLQSRKKRWKMNRKKPKKQRRKRKKKKGKEKKKRTHERKK